MGFQPGRKKTGGRQKGSITKDRQQLLDKAKELGVDVFEILLRFAANDYKGLGYSSDTRVIGIDRKGEPIEEDRISSELRVKAAGDAAQYMLPKLKAIDVVDKTVVEAVKIYKAAWGGTQEPTDEKDKENE